MSDFKSKAEILRYLADGGKLAVCGCGPIWFDADKGMINGNLKIDGSLERYTKYVEPNPHTKGTFAWAREEAKRGRNVARLRNMPLCSYNATAFKPDQYWPVQAFDATDWEIVS